MGRSYLFTGRDTEHLSPAERQLEALYDRIDRPGYRISPQAFYQLPEAQQLMDSLYGGLTDRIPPGSQIVSQTPGKVTYRDAEGYEHNIIRKPDGQFTETSNRPSILPNKEQDTFLDQLRQQVQQAIGAPTQFAQIPPEVQAQLDAMSANEQARIAQQGQEDEGRLIAGLYGQGINRSSVANDAAARFAQLQGLIRQQQRADAAGRQLGLQQYLTGLGQQRNESLQSLLANLTGQGTQRDIAGAGLDLDRARLSEASRQFGATNYLDTLRTQLQQEELDAQNSGFNKFLKTLSAAGALAQGAGTAYGALRRR